jgi:hypothetical protein
MLIQQTVCRAKPAERGQGRETYDLTLYTGLKLWDGAEFWAYPEIDQGFGVGNAHGIAGFPSAESYKLGFSEPASFNIFNDNPGGVTGKIVVLYVILAIANLAARGWALFAFRD